MKTEKLKSKWSETAKQLLVGYTIIDVLYPTGTSSAFYHQPPCLVLEKHNANKKSEIVIVPQSDDEGNDGGSLYISNIAEDTTHTLPRI